MFLAIGAFFLDWYWNLSILAVLTVMTAFTGAENLKKALRNLLILGIFTLPVLIVRLFTVKEGMLVHIWFLEFYTLALIQSLNTVLRIFIFAMVSFIVLMLWFPVKEWKRVKEKHVLLDILFTSIELYQDMLSDFIAFYRSKGKKKNIIDFIDSSYQKETGEKLGKKQALRKTGISR